MYLTTFLLLVVSRGRSYYVAPAYAMLLAAGAVWLESWLRSRTPVVRRITVGVLCVFVLIGVAAGVVLVKPVAPINSALWNFTAEMGDTLREMVGWPDMAEQVAKIYATIPEAEKPRTVILAGNYGEAGALDLYETRVRPTAGYHRREQPVGARLRRSGAGDGDRGGLRSPLRREFLRNV